MGDTSRPLSTLYDVLRIQKTATAEDIRKAYKRRALQTHPDKLGPTASVREKEIAESEFRLVTHAFQVLSDAQRRKRYDSYLRPPPKHTYSRSQSAPSSSKDDWDASAQQQTKLKRDRAEWAKKVAREHEERMQNLHSRPSMPTNPPAAPVEPQIDNPLVRKFFEDLRARNPEWVQREREIRQRQAERTRFVPRYSTTG
ncbi:DnaJ-domain-containing protein [Pleurotus eryngii]|uniref:DnaJ-domain-containing protein n=1 Tax=Pleurotus eryngii TaxID=5323 RepID=A0A9P6A3J5_PLEER|nr:DnaJ-domain-containing protein [Pleurotus eryngii]